MAQDFKTYMIAALQEAGLSDDAVTAAVDKIAAHEKLSPKLNALLRTATDDYNAQVGRVRSLMNWYEGETLPDGTRKVGAKQQYESLAGEYQRAIDENNRLKVALGGTTQPDQTQQPVGIDPNLFMSKADAARLIQDMGARYASTIKDTAWISAQHATRFKEAPDMEEIDRIAREKNLPIRAAYNEYIAPRVEEESKQQRAEWEKNTRAEIERDLRSRYQMPADPTPAEVAPVWNRPSADMKPLEGSALDQDLLATWNSVPARK